MIWWIWDEFLGHQDAYGLDGKSEIHIGKARSDSKIVKKICRQRGERCEVWEQREGTLKGIAYEGFIMALQDTQVDLKIHWTLWCFEESGWFHTD